MGKLNLVNKIILGVSFVCAILAVILSFVLDENDGYPGVATLTLTFSPALGVALILLLVIAGFVLMLTNKHYYVGLISYSLAATIFLCMFIYAAATKSKAVSIYPAFVCAILYVVYLILSLIDWILSRDYVAYTDKGQKSAKQISFEIEQ